MSKHNRYGFGFQVSLIFCQIKHWPHKMLVLLSLKLMELRYLYLEVKSGV